MYAEAHKMNSFVAGHLFYLKLHCFSLYFHYPGDNPPHDFWNQTVPGQLAFTKNVVEKTALYLSDKNIYPTLGNHGNQLIMYMNVCIMYV